MRNDPLDAVWRESEMALDFVRRQVATSRTASCTTNASSRPCRAGPRLLHLSDAQFDEAAFEAK